MLFVAPFSSTPTVLPKYPNPSEITLLASLSSPYCQPMRAVEPKLAFKPSRKTSSALGNKRMPAPFPCPWIKKALVRSLTFLAATSMQSPRAVVPESASRPASTVYTPGEVMVHPHMVIELLHCCAFATPRAAMTDTIAETANRHTLIFISFSFLYLNIPHVCPESMKLGLRSLLRTTVVVHVIPHWRIGLHTTSFALSAVRGSSWP